MKTSNNPFRDLPAVNDVLQMPRIAALEGKHAHNVIVEAIRAELAETRARLAQGQSLNGEWSPESVATNIEKRLSYECRPRLGVPAHRRRIRHGRKQQRRRHRHRSADNVSREGSHRLARPAHRDWRQL